MPQGRFTAQVDKQIANARAKMLAVRNESVQRTIEIAQTPVSMGGRLRVDTGFLRASFVASVGAGNFALTDKPDGEGRYSFDMGQVSLVILGAELTDTITGVWTASYARPREYGARGQAGDRFVGLAAQQWPRTVNEVVAELKARGG